jgi:tripartite-type tricarboxylate transporter receptor subunit TctC
MTVKQFKRICCAIAGVSLGLVSQVSSAQDFPNQPLTIIVPFTGGGATDILARIIAEGLTKELGQSVVVANVPGAGGTIGQAKAARAAPNGYTLLFGNLGTLAAQASLYTNLSYNILENFTPIASVGDAPQVISIRNNLPVKTFEEFVEYAKQNQVKMNFGTAGVGSGSFLGGVVLNAAIGVKIQPVHYRGAAQTIADLMAGQIDYAIESSSTVEGSYSTGKTRGIGVMRDKRVSILPEVQATGETKFPVNFDIWNMILVPSNVPQPILEKLNTAINRVLTQPEMVQRYEKMGLSLPTEVNRSLKGSAQLLSTEVKNWNRLLKEAGIEPQASN